MAGRPSKRTPQRVQVILDALGSGSTRRDACVLAGIDERTLQRWARSAAFAAALTLAETQAVVDAAATVHRAALRDWRAALEFLKRKRPDEWGERISLRFYVEQLADEFGLDRAAALREAEAILAGGGL